MPSGIYIRKQGVIYGGFKKGHPPFKGAFQKGVYLGYGFKKGNIFGKKSCRTETRRKISLSLKGHTVTEEIKKKISNSLSMGKSPKWHGGISPSYRRKNVSRPKPNNCEICGKTEKKNKKSLCLDHDHKTGLFRGWLCHTCNAGLGNLKDSIDLLIKATEYLKNN